MRTALMNRLELSIPVIGAPMGGGPSTTDLVVAVCEAGGLGSIAGGYLDGNGIASEIAKVRSATARPFAVNLFVPSPDADDVDDAETRRLLARLRDDLGLPAEIPAASMPDFAEQVDAVIESPPAAVSFTFGVLDANVISRFHDAGCFLIGTATTVAEAQALVAAGVDAICAQGAEAGAHRGSFLEGAEGAPIGTFALVPQVVDVVDVSVIAAGAVADGRGVAAALALGAQAVQMGTALLLCPEAGTSSTHRRAIASVAAEDTCVTDRLTGRHARTIRNALVDALSTVDVPRYPAMHLLTAELRRAAAASDRPDLMALWCGQSGPLARSRSAGDVVRDAVADAVELLTSLASS